MSNLQLALPGLLPADPGVEWVWQHDFDEMSEVKRFEHATVMRREVVEAIAPHAGGVYVDATFGAGGHTVALLEAAPKARIVAIDRDPSAIEQAEARLAPVADRVVLVRGTFGHLRDRLRAVGIGRVDGIVADLGVSSPQLDDATRGMSFRREGPIDMRMDPEHGETALDLIAKLDDEHLADVIFQYGEERSSRRIARSIRKALAAGELGTTRDLRRAVVRAVGPARIGGLDPATRTFQALRIAVNHELEQLEGLLDALPDVLAEGAVAAIIAFHSLEDRLVKRAFLREGWEVVTKKPLVASEDECARNARARSAKLRAARRAARSEAE
jgi:16S rRNA (cytosine1402-N4)-methyltransferase